MRASEVVFRPIGIVHSRHREAAKTPIQPCYAADCEGTVEVFPEYAAGLQDIEGYSHIYLLYYLHQAPAASLLVKPFLQDVERGLFATRAPCRPNPLGMSIVRLLGREGNILRISGVDILEGRRCWISNPMRRVLTASPIPGTAGRTKSAKRTPGSEAGGISTRKG